jgi:hypothetical protein
MEPSACEDWIGGEGWRVLLRRPRLGDEWEALLVLVVLSLGGFACWRPRDWLFSGEGGTVDFSGV